MLPRCLATNTLATPATCHTAWRTAVVFLLPQWRCFSDPAPPLRRPVVFLEYFTDYLNDLLTRPRFLQTFSALYCSLLLSRCKYLRRVDVSQDRQALRQCPLIGLTEVGETAVGTAPGHWRKGRRRIRPHQFSPGALTGRPALGDEQCLIIVTRIL